ncbi:MAG TPA: hypothetical protein VK469_11870 [Candidatus Kapabacteria bacterium]|nr:hypothetical protein [Candidatus Kapabacteria bacterium]
MYLRVTNSIPTFLDRTQRILEALQKEESLKKRLYRDFDFDDRHLERGFVAYAKAQLAEIEYARVTQYSPFKIIFETWREEAMDIFDKHTAFLKVGLRYDPQKQLELGIIGRKEVNSTFEWINNALRTYQLLLQDEETLARMAKYNLRDQDFVNGKLTIAEFKNAYLAMIIDHPQVMSAIEKRDEAIGELVDIVSEIQVLLLQAFEDEPKLFKKYDLPIVDDESGQVIMITMVKDSSIT